MGNYCILRFEKIKTPGDTTLRFNHNARKNQPVNADISCKANKQLVGNKDDSYLTLFKRRKKSLEYYDTHKMRKDAIIGFEAMMTMSSGYQVKVDIDAWAKANIAWLNKTFTENNVMSAVLHMDEVTPHIHAFIVPEKNGRISQKNFFAGAAALSFLQTSYANEMKQFGLDRGIKVSKASHEDLRRLNGIINTALEKELPPVEKNESAETYRERANETYKQLSFQNAGLKTELDRKKKIEKQLKSKDDYIDKIMEQAANETSKLKQSYDRYEKLEYALEHCIHRSNFSKEK